MQQLINILLFIIPSLGIIAGLSLSVSVPLFFIANLFLIRKYIRIDFSKYKTELVFFAWLLASCFWSINVTASLTSLVKTFIISTIFYVLIYNSGLLLKIPTYLQNQLSFVLVAPLILFYIEVLTNGSISIWFRNAIQKKEDLEFYLFYLDRGCSLLSLFSWAVIAQLLKQRMKLHAIIIYAIILTALYFSDSLSAFVGFIVGGVIFLLLQISVLNNPRILFLPIITGAIIFVSIAISMNPCKSCDDYDFLPFSSKHRLFIWSFTATKFTEKPIIGWGYDSSRYFDVKDSDMVNYQNIEINPLPSHPHNNIMQILLETGIVGFILYMSLIYKYLHLWRNSFPSQKYRLDIQATGYAFLGNFFIISMISFNMWQSWWISSVLWSSMLLFLTTRPDYTQD